ncbi:MAG: hypothetical protein KA175_01340 [Flavobacteriales bacterium]|nr:hypothetical protein [Flavobacteriales bacterium]
MPTQGDVSIGGSYGQLPMNAPGAGPWNGSAQGSVKAEVLGLPLLLSFDLGTDMPVRGQRQRIKLAFDADRFATMHRWELPEEVHDAKGYKDSLLACQAELVRKLRGAQFTLDATKLAQQAQQRLALDTPSVVMPDTALPKLPSTEIKPDMPALPELSTSPIDSLQGVVNTYTGQLKEIDELIARAEQASNLSAAKARAARSGLRAMDRFLGGIRRFELGTCAPPTSDLLIDGTTFRGVSIDYSLHDVHLSVDHGVSYDDVWMNAEPLRQQIQALQQSLFITDEKDLTPKRLTAVRVGAGEMEGTYVRLGYLFGRAPAVPGFMDQLEQQELRNHVVGLEVGHAIKKIHHFRIAYGRSITGSAAEGEGENGVRSSALFGSESNDGQALKASYTADLQGLGTQLNMDGKYFGPLFHSVGLAFVRRDSRAVGAGIAQQVGKKVRVRLRHSYEVRGLNEADGMGSMTLSRSFLNITYRPWTPISLRATYVPVVTRTERSDAQGLNGRNQMMAGGFDLRKRWKRIVALAGGDGTYYEWTRPGTTPASSYSLSAYMSVNKGSTWSCRLGWMSASIPDTSNMELMQNWSITAEYQFERIMLRVGGGVQLGHDGSIGWSIESSKALTRSLFVTVSARRPAPIQIIYPQDDINIITDPYNCEIRIGYRW